MKSAIDVFSELGRRLCSFGKDDESRLAIHNACRVNDWFSPAEIERAVAAIRDEMLQREKLKAWLAHYPAPVGRPRNVLVVMAGNIPLVGFFDLLCVLAAGHRCLVKPSTKDRVLMQHMITLLHEIEPQLPIVRYDDSQRLDAVIATGSDNTNRYFRTRFAGIPSLLRGSRQSVAVLSGQETDDQLARLCDDIWAYSGLGCRNVSLLFLPRNHELKLRMPPVNNKYRNNYRQQRALCEMTGTPCLDLGAAVAVEQCEFPAALSLIAYTCYDTPEEVAAWLTEHDDQLQCVVTECISHRRRVNFGRAQSPALTDYADDKDVMQFLCGL